MSIVISSYGFVRYLGAHFNPIDESSLIIMQRIKKTNLTIMVLNVITLLSSAALKSHLKYVPVDTLVSAV